MKVYLVNSTINEYVCVSSLSKDFNMYHTILTVLQCNYPPGNRLFPNTATQKLVASIVSRWDYSHQCSITYDVSHTLKSITQTFIEAMITVSFINYGFQFEYHCEDPTIKVKVDEWYVYMNPENRKRKASHDENETITLPCSLDDIWKDSYETGTYETFTTNEPLTTRDLAIVLFERFQPEPKPQDEQLIPFDRIITSDNFVSFMKDLSVTPKQLVNDDKLRQSPLGVYFSEDFKKKYQTLSEIDEYHRYDLTYDYFKKEIYFKKDLVLKHKCDPQHKFSLLQLKGEKLQLSTIIEVISEFANSCRVNQIYKETTALEIEEADDKFNMYESVNDAVKKEYDEFDTKGKSKIPIDAHIWIISESV